MCVYPQAPAGAIWLRLESHIQCLLRSLSPDRMSILDAANTATAFSCIFLEILKELIIYVALLPSPSMHHRFLLEKAGFAM